LFNYTVSDTGRDATVSEANRKDLLKILSDNRPKKIKKPRIAPRLADLSEIISSRQFDIFNGGSTNVVFFVPWLLKEGGAERFLKDLSEGLIANGFGVAFVITETERPHNSIDGTDVFRELTPYIYDVKNITNQNLKVFIQQVVNNSNIQSVINVGSNAFYDQLLTNGIADKTKVVCDVLFNPVGHFKNHEKTNMHFSDVVFVYEELKRIAEKRQMFKGRGHVIHVGIPLTEKYEIPATSANSRMTPKLTFGWLGRFSTEKRPSWFLKLAEEFGSQANFVMAGTGPLLEMYQSEGKEISGLSVLGFISDPSELYQNVDVMLNTSEIEGISVTAMEALVKGIPMIVTDVGGMGELVVDGENGWVVSPSDYGDIESIVRRLIQDSKMVSEAKERILKSPLNDHFNVTNMVQKYIGVLLPH
jgi:glycosyltransferase involved in cell wall biosynthesis